MKSSASSTLSTRLLIWTWLITAVSTFIYTGITLWGEYTEDRQKIYNQISIIQKSWSASLSNSTWSLDRNMLEIQLKGLKQLDGISYISIYDNVELISSKGERSSPNSTLYKIPLVNDNSPVGHLEVELGLSALKEKYVSKATWTLIYQGIKSSIVSIILFLIFESLVTRHLKNLIISIKNSDSNEDGTPYTIPNKKNRNDEIDTLLKKLNEKKKLASDASIKLSALNLNLESQVKERTTELFEKNISLEESVERLTKMQQKLIAQQKLLSLNEIAKALAHELRNPLNLIINSVIMIDEIISELKQSNPDDDHFSKTEVALKIITNNSNRIDKLIAKMNSLYAVNSALENTKHEMSITDEISDIVKFYTNSAELAQGGKISFSLNLPTQLEKIYFIPSDFKTIMTSIIDNSIHFLKEKQSNLEVNFFPRIDIDVNQTGTITTIILRDNGPGIPNDKLDRIFEPFYTTKKGSLGAGLGLSMVADIVSRNGAEIQVKSAVDSFTAFILHIPNK